MRLALTHNLRSTDDPAQRGFSSPETVRELVAAARRLGHEVEPVEVSGPLVDTIKALSTLAPDLVLNIAEGWTGPWRQSALPTLLADLGLPFTGSGPTALARALDKHLTKLVARSCGIATPRWRFLRDAEQPIGGVPLPAVVKPNFESCSKGITRDSLATTPEAVRARAAALLRDYPDGVLVEEFVPGRDLTVPYLEAVGGRFGGALVPAEYTPTRSARERGHIFFDFDVKRDLGASTDLRVPAAVPDAVADEARETTRRIVWELGCRDIAKADFRLSDDGVLHLLEVNGLPALLPGGETHRAAALAGLDPRDGVVDALIRSAVRRQG